MTTASGRARRGWLPFSSRAGGVALTSTKECNRATRTSASRRETDCERCVQERGEKRREEERERGRGGEKRLGERFVGTKGRRRDGADSANAGRPDAFSRVPFISRRRQYISNDSRRTCPIHAYRGKTAPVTRFHPFALHHRHLLLLVSRFLHFSARMRNLCLVSARSIVSRARQRFYAALYAVVHATRACPAVVPRRTPSYSVRV